ncbi:Hypothetical protein PHPALM_14049 [Phytophthora palmivora]|uniref:Uncharacterized protein n=1 Tax=Phytophthora palmivora TaxID=4796 RepID=A0A2P4XVS2_9STRA|nr:Hypothetical protein PHPALM_14049 [Phytophthora palmivora]
MYSKAKTYAARGSGSRMAELAGATDSQIRRLGRWNASSMEGCYLTALQREATRSLAGFPPNRRTFLGTSITVTSRKSPALPYYFEMYIPNTSCGPFLHSIRAPSTYFLLN